MRAEIGQVRGLQIVSLLEIREAFLNQHEGSGLAILEILTMCPTGWFIETNEAPGYLDEKLAAVHQPGVLKDVLAP